MSSIDFDTMVKMIVDNYEVCKKEGKETVTATCMGQITFAPGMDGEVIVSTKSLAEIQIEMEEVLND